MIQEDSLGVRGLQTREGEYRCTKALCGIRALCFACGGCQWTTIVAHVMFTTRIFPKKFDDTSLHVRLELPLLGAGHLQALLNNMSAFVLFGSGALRKLGENRGADR